ncbi:pre-mRNA-splicing factor CWC25 homolog [Rhinatrema bivittatum]|uniref:pre-mRNA-splicing factor CWC25 homolog n=1 Tax=Rhinatrema bivittatum TaxID=194408 RepID=UPI0011265BD6|nr:pre-mRNA-splicing factor CWC25 homolog [Rhinatrema bivittatum]
MGGGDLNLKKSWHPQTLRNVEKVWKAEQRHEAERKKIEELQRELRDERAREEMQRYAEDAGTVRKKEEKLDWMYQGPSSMVDREEYLLGRPVDKYILDKMQDKETGPSAETGLLPGSIFASSGANFALDMASKIREDPLFMIRKREEEKKKEVLKNPMKMKKIRELLQSTLEKRGKKKKKEKRKKHKKRKHRSSSSEEERDHEKIQKKRESSPSATFHSKVPGYGLQFRASEHRQWSPESAAADQGKTAQKCRSHSGSRNLSRSPPQHTSKGAGQREAQDRRARSRSPTGHSKQHNSKVDKRERERPRSSPKKEGYRRQQASGYTRRISPEELERKRQDMMQDG